MNFRKLADIAEALDVKEEDIIAMSTEVNINTLENNHVVIYSKGDTYIVNGEKELYEKMLKDKDEEIAFLRGLVGKG